MLVDSRYCVDYANCTVGNWQEELQKYISPDQLPQAYGGTRCEPDPWCTDYVSSCSVWCEWSESVSGVRV